MRLRTTAPSGRKRSPPFTVRLDARSRRRLGRLARACDRTVSSLVQEAVAAYLDAQEWQVEAITEALRGADARPEAGVPNERVRSLMAT